MDVISKLTEIKEELNDDGFLGVTLVINARYHDQHTTFEVYTDTDGFIWDAVDLNGNPILIQSEELPANPNVNDMINCMDINDVIFTEFEEPVEEFTNELLLTCILIDYGERVLTP